MMPRMETSVSKSILREFKLTYLRQRDRSTLVVNLRDADIADVRVAGSGQPTAISILQLILDYPTEFESLMTTIRKELATDVAEKAFDEATK